jgi:hypothetical protein
MELAKALRNSPSIAAAGREVGMSRDGAHHTYRAIKVKAADRCEQLSITRDRVLKRFEELAEGAQREMQLSFMGSPTQKVKLDAPEVRLKANIELAKIMGCYADSTEQVLPGGKSSAHMVSLVVEDERRAVELARLIAGDNPDGVVIEVDAPVDKDVE